MIVSVFFSDVTLHYCLSDGVVFNLQNYIHSHLLFAIIFFMIPDFLFSGVITPSIHVFVGSFKLIWEKTCSIKLHFFSLHFQSFGYSEFAGFILFLWAGRSSDTSILWGLEKFNLQIFLKFMLTNLCSCNCSMIFTASAISYYKRIYMQKHYQIDTPSVHHF